MRALGFAREHKGLRLYAWVILDTHFHAIVAGPELAQAIGELKKSTARELLAQLKVEGREWLLNQLGYYRARHKTGSQHQVWQEGVHPQSIASDETMLQKLEYLHNNPVKRGLVASPEHWRYSSAHEWLPGALPVMRVDDWRSRVEQTKQSFGDKRVPKPEFGNEEYVSRPMPKARFHMGVAQV